MATHFDAAFARTFGLEDGYSDNPHDRGGPTRWGTTEAKAREHGYAGDMRDFPADFAKRIAKADFWDVLKLDEIAELSPRIADEIYDTGYNTGPSVPARFLQRALNAFNRSHRDEGPDYPEVKVDGIVGEKTVDALAAFLAYRRDGETVMFRALNAQQGVHYLRLAEKRETDEEFTFGWFLNRVQ